MRMMISSKPCWILLAISFLSLKNFGETDSSSSCTNVPIASRFDCFPRGEPDREECVRRRCCWSTMENSSAPVCFYPEDYRSYRIIEGNRMDDGVTIYASLVHGSVYGKDVNTLKIDISYVTDTWLRVKIIDTNNTRYVPPYPNVDGSKINSECRKKKYKVVLLDDTFGFAVIRRDTNLTIFDTRNVGGFTFSDQFIQLSALLPSTYIYGLGEHKNNLLLDSNWKTYTLFNHDPNATAENVNLYGSHPFYLATEEDGKSHGVFLLNSNAMDIILQPAPAITYRTIGGILDFHYFLGPSARDVVGQYTEAVGRPFLPPYWSFGFHLCRFGLTDLQSAVAVWQRNFDAELPYDGVWVDIDYMESYNDFTVSKNYSGLFNFAECLHTLGMKLVPILDPGVASREPPGEYLPYDEGIKLDIFIKNASNLPLEGQVWNLKNGTVFPDFTHPRAQEYYQDMLVSLYKKVQYDGIWLDMNEISNFYSNGSKTGCESTEGYLNNPPYVPRVPEGDLNFRTVCMSAQQYYSSHYNLHNLYGLTQSLVTFESLKNVNGKRPFILSRSTFSGSGPFTAHWTGDTTSTWDDLKQTVPDIISFNLFGIPMVGADICGFHDSTTKELCIRWSQLGAFYPFSRNHNDKGTDSQDPAALGIVEEVTKAFRIKYHLVPYLYTLFWLAHSKGDPVIVPLFFEYPLDKITYNLNTQFLWGGALLIIPVLNEGETSVDAYFPKDTWYDLYTSISLESNGQYVHVDAPMDHIPLYIRAGYIIPYQEPERTLAKSRENPFGLYVSLNSTNQAVGSLFWDDGDSIDTSENHPYISLQFTFSNNTLYGSFLQRSYQTRIILDTIRIMGISLDISEVFINSHTHTSYIYTKPQKVLTIYDAKIDLLETFTVQLK